MNTSIKRVAFVDIAKGLAIISVIIGHCVALGSFTRTLIFSFHMPLFFIMTGYTTKLADSWDKLWKKTGKDAKKLLLLAVLMLIVYDILIIIKYRSFSKYGLKLNFGPLPAQLFWATGYNTAGHPNLGIPWFFVSMFWGRFLCNVIFRLTKNENASIVIFLVLGIFGLTFNDSRMLPQNLDVTFVAMMFMAAGMLLKKLDNHLADKEKQRKVVSVSMFAVSAFIWAFCLYHGWFIEMAARRYDHFLVCAIEAICATYVIIVLSKLIEKIPFASDTFVTVGQASLYILVCHYFDGFLDPVLLPLGTFVSTAIKIVLDVSLGTGYLFAKKKIREKTKPEA